MFTIVMALYGLKSNGPALRSFLTERLDMMLFESIISDPHVWIRPSTKVDGEQYYGFILVYIEDLIAII